ncbi:hypothetical protein [Flavobacterium sp. N3904]|uniref:hypothetical protein n=1 Tax=Flavobacterium sp. N3904 TaxID=2986835 RepID=UPI0022250891|nr:hypothetical protein [Flavobacterium sp. N3904]
MKLKFSYFSILMLFVFNSFQINAQKTIPVKAGWSFLAEPYVMFPNMAGDVGLGNLPDVTADVTPSDIFSNLQMGAMLYLEASNEKWNVNSDLLYMDLAQGVKGNALISNGEVSAKQLGWEVAGLYKVRPNLQFGLGLLYNSIKSGVDINQNNLGGGTTNRKREISEGWVDPMFIAVFTNKPGKKIIYKFRGEIGGFGLGADTNFAWQVQAYAGYRFSELFQIQGGYRVIGLDYENGSGSDRFLYNMDTFGPVIKFGFNF